MRTIEALIAVAILVGGVAGLTAYLQLPPPHSLNSQQLYSLGYTVLQELTDSGVLGRAAFNPQNPTYQGQLQAALQTVLPANVVYNLTYYDVVTTTMGGVNTTYYRPIGYITNSGGIRPKFTVTISFVVPSPNMSFTLQAKPYPATVFILNCSDALGWWITGYTASQLATNLKQLLTQRTYFQNVVTINNTNQLYTLLNSGSLQVGSQQYQAKNSIIINVFGESVPISYSQAQYYQNNEGFSGYDYWLGQMVSNYNITWVQVVGFPFYEVSNTNYFTSPNNIYGCYNYPYFGVIGICGVPAQYVQDGSGTSYGLNNFMAGFTGARPNSCSIYVSPAPGGIVYASEQLQAAENYYGIYVSPIQTSSRSLINPNNCGLIPLLPIYDPVTSGDNTYYPAEVYSNQRGSGYLIDIGLARIPDIRITALALFEFFHPQIIPTTGFASSGYTRLVILQLGEV